MGRKFVSPKMVSYFCSWQLALILTGLGQTCVLPKNILRCFKESGNKKKQFEKGLA